MHYSTPPPSVPLLIVPVHTSQCGLLTPIVPPQAAGGCGVCHSRVCEPHDPCGAPAGANGCVVHALGRPFRPLHHQPATRCGPAPHPYQRNGRLHHQVSMSGSFLIATNQEGCSILWPFLVCPDRRWLALKVYMGCTRIGETHTSRGNPGGGGGGVAPGAHTA